MKVVAIIQARVGSTRLPGKVLEFIGRIPALSHVYLRAQHAVEHVVLAIPDTQENDILERYGMIRDVPVVRGPEDDVLTRYVLAARAHDADVIVRITADCPFVDPVEITRVLDGLESDVGYCSNCYETNRRNPACPPGLDVEAFPRWALEDANVKTRQKHDREHVTPYMRDMSETVGYVPTEIHGNYRWTLDTPKDLEFFRAVAEHLDVTPPKPTTSEILDLLTAHPEIAEINRGET